MCAHRRLPFCDTQRPGSCCAAPTPRDTSNYYNRHHLKNDKDSCRCRFHCYCPIPCKCPRRNMNGRYIETIGCDEDEDKCFCCGNGRMGGPGCNTKDTGCRNFTTGRRRSARKPARACCSLPRPSSPPRTLCCRCREELGEDDDCCPPCCPPYKPPKRKPICYPPIKCCETNECGQSPTERICYTPGRCPPNPKYCPCGSAMPCDCDLESRRRAAICENTPCCRRCGRKVFAAEKLCAADGAFHTSCFSCYCCHKPLEVTNVYSNQGEIYCKQCYTRYFGVSGYGYGNNKCNCKECVNN